MVVIMLCFGMMCVCDLMFMCFGIVIVMFFSIVWVGLIVFGVLLGVCVDLFGYCVMFVGCGGFVFVVCVLFVVDVYGEWGGVCCMSGVCYGFDLLY